MQAPKGVGILLNSEAPITVEGRSESVGVSSIFERGITQTDHLPRSSALKIDGVKLATDTPEIRKDS